MTPRSFFFRCILLAVVSTLGVGASKPQSGEPRSDFDSLLLANQAERFRVEFRDLFVVAAGQSGERCSVARQAPSRPVKCGTDGHTAYARCVQCSTPSGKKCGDPRCVSDYCACNPAACTAQAQNLECQ